ncbi:Cell division cycle cdt2-like protein [Cladobotryum mycophilum]|uniref:Cell division cycle cdt2-like protein n=1 Tax=Cladobotryum mycophilum TaxID=491253 RepID=A0ABR0SNH9_9HYPO
MHYHHGPSTSADEVPSSPPAINPSSPASSMLLSPTRSTRRKERRNPSVTPRRFGRFFTPRSSLPGGGRRILGMLDDTAMNHRQLVSPQSIFSDALGSDPLCPPSPSEGRSTIEQEGNKRRLIDAEQSPIKRRRGTAAHEMPPPPLNLPGVSAQSSREGEVRTLDGSAEPRPTQESLGERRKATLNLFFKASRNGTQGQGVKSSPASKNTQATGLKVALTLEGYEPKPIRKFRNRGVGSQLLDREHGFSSHHGRQYLAYPACDPRTETSAFYSRSIDTHHCTTHDGTGNTIPFSLASCHKAPVTAIGDEQGYVRLFNTTMTNSASESKVDVFIPVHDNAIMGLAFSEDDMRLATACGDRTSRIVDVATQTVAAELSGSHWDSLRQVSFQPGQAGGDIIATSDRAGRIQIWDLRCSFAPVDSFSYVEAGGVRQRDPELNPFLGKTVNTIENAHERKALGVVSSASVTAIQWMPAGREHLLLSGSEANASIKLWDTRYIKPRRQAEDTPLAVTPEPRGHAWRSYGITSMALSSDASRLYAVCKDSTVYAYSTSHLMLGEAPELVDGAAKRRPGGVKGLGPLYGFKHSMFRAQSFYVKCSIRPSINGSSELLAVGSSDGCAVLFPTDERYLRSALAQQEHIIPDVSQSFSSQTASTPSGLGAAGTPSIPISRKLVTASDDYIVRQWQQNEGQARHLRQVGESDVERHMAGWADVSNDWDQCDEE